jgi:glycosyltransferase involved in cell wall biosynthesis
MSWCPTRILFLASSYPRYCGDTASVFLRYLAEQLANSGVDVHVLAPAERRGGTTIEKKVTVHRFQYFPATWQALAYGSGMLPNLKRSPSLWLQVPFFLLAMIYSLLRLHASQRFDVIHAHWILPQGLVGFGASRLFRAPLVVSLHGTDAFALNRGFARRLKRMILGGTTAWTANTTSTATALTHDSRLHSPRIIPMGVDVALFSSGNPAALRRDLPEGEFVVLFVGRLIENKGCRNLIEAISRLSANARACTTLWVVGDGDQREHLERAARNLAIGTKVRFFGFVDHQRLGDFYAAADLIVVPSKIGSAGETEGQAVVVLEAFAARRCVIATAIGGIPSMVRHHSTGVLVEPDNSFALSEAIEELLNDPALRHRIADAAFAEVRERYSWVRVATEFKTLYDDILARAPGQTRR